LLQCPTDELLAGERNEKERQRRKEREQLILRSVGLVGCGEIAVSYVACLTACGGQVTHVYDAGTAYVSSIRQHTSAYVSIRQHTSAYVSIRQHTSAYTVTHVHDADAARARDRGRIR
jgi:hypothetical protein